MDHSESNGLSYNRTSLADSLRQLAEDVDNLPESVCETLEAHIRHVQGSRFAYQTESIVGASPIRVTHLLPRTSASKYKGSSAIASRSGCVKVSSPTTRAQFPSNDGVVQISPLRPRPCHSSPMNRNIDRRGASADDLYPATPEAVLPVPEFTRIPHGTSATALQAVNLRLKLLVSELKSRREEAQNIAAATTFSMDRREAQIRTLMATTSRLREGIETSRSGLRVLAKRMESVEQKLIHLQGEIANDTFENKPVSQIQHLVRNWWTNYDFLAQSLGEIPGSPADESDQVSDILTNARADDSGRQTPSHWHAETFPEELITSESDSPLNHTGYTSADALRPRISTQSIDTYTDDIDEGQEDVEDSVSMADDEFTMDESA